MHTRQSIWLSQGGSVLPFSFMKCFTVVFLWLVLWALVPDQYQNLILYIIGVR